MYVNGNKLQRKAARRLHYRIKERFTTDIGLEARIGADLYIPHHVGIVISGQARIGKSLAICQNTTMGKSTTMSAQDTIVIGDNVTIGANSCIIGAITIGDNVTLGAMSFVNRDIPANCTYITRKTSDVIIKPAH